MFKRARLIYNPVSGRELLHDKLPDILDIYEQAGYETSTFRTTKEEKSAMKEARRAAEAGFDLIIAAGGDGTVNEVVAGIVSLNHRPKIAVIPGGTSNDFAHALGVSRDNIIQAAKVIEKNQFLSMDIGCAKSEGVQSTFVNIAALGTLSELTFQVSPELKSIFGYLAYFAKGAEMLPQVTTPSLVKVDYDEGSYEGEASLIFVTLTETFGGMDYVAPDTIPGDGRFTLIVVKTSNIMRIANIFMKILNNGQHVGEKDIIYKKTNKVRVEALDGQALKVNLDGDLGGETPVEFVNLQQYVAFLVDLDNMSQEPLDRSLKEEAK